MTITDPKIKQLIVTKDIKGLIIELMSSDRLVRKEAAEALGQIGDAEVVRPLIVAAEDRDDGVALAAIEALRRVRDTRAVNHLLDALQNKHWSIRNAAFVALGKIADKRAVKPLLKILLMKDLTGNTPNFMSTNNMSMNMTLQDKIDLSNAMRREAARALGRIHHKDAVKPLIDGLFSHQIWYVRVLAAQTLGEIGDPSALKPLIAALNKEYEDDRVRCAVVAALGRIGDIRAIDSLINAKTMFESKDVIREIDKTLKILFRLTKVA